MLFSAPEDIVNIKPSRKLTGYKKCFFDWNKKKTHTTRTNI